MKTLIAATAAIALLSTPALAAGTGEHAAGTKPAAAQQAKQDKQAQSITATKAGELERAAIGTVKSVEAGMLTLENGSEYKLGEGLELGDIGAGDQVKISYDVVENDYVATAVEPAGNIEAGEAEATRTDSGADVPADPADRPEQDR